MQNIVNILLIITIILLSIYIIYFNSIDNNYDINNYENFGSNYKNICKKQKTQFYDMVTLNGSKSTFNIALGTPNCSYYCDICNCDVYTIKDNKCNVYSNIPNFSVNVNCGSNILPITEYTIYNGEGFVNPNYFNQNKNSFVYNDYLLNQSTKLQQDYNDINNKIIYYLY